MTLIPMWPGGTRGERVGLGPVDLLMWRGMSKESQSLLTDEDSVRILSLSLGLDARTAPQTCVFLGLL